MSNVDFADFEKLALLEEIMRTSSHFKVDWANIKFPPGRTMSQSQAYINALRSSDGQDYSSPLPAKQYFASKYQTPAATPRPPPKARTTVVATPTVTADGTVKRGRGRPRKNPLPVATGTPKTQTVVVAEGGIKKRGRGRPSKASIAAEAAAKAAAAKAKKTGASEAEGSGLQLESEKGSEKEYVSEHEGGKSDTRDSTPMGGEIIG